MNIKKFQNKIITIGTIFILSIFLISTVSSQYVQSQSKPNDYLIPVSSSGSITFFNDNTGEILFSINHNGEFNWYVGTSIGIGELSSGSYDGIKNLTLIKIDNENFTDLGIKDASTINISGSVFYVNSVINNTYLYGLGELSFLNISDWTYRIDSYFNINGGATDERGFSVSKDGLWQWSMYSPSSQYSNPLDFCLASRNNSFADLMCAHQEGVIEYYSPIKLNPTFTQTGCSSSTRGTIYYVNGESGQADRLQICSKDSSDHYGWRNVSLS